MKSKKESLANRLTFKADIYSPTGRIFSFEGKWADLPNGGTRFTPTGGEPREFTAGQLTDGHGRTIC